MSRALRLILAIALLGTVLVGPAAQSAKAPPPSPTNSSPTGDDPIKICIETACWDNGCEDECEGDLKPCNDDRCDPCNHAPCGIDPCDYVNCDPCELLPCRLCHDLDCPGPYRHAIGGVPPVSCRLEPCPVEVPCRDEPCQKVCKPDPHRQECAETLCGYLGLVGLSNVAGVDCLETVCDLEEDLGARLVYTGDSDSDGIEDCHDPDVDGDGLSDALEEAIGYDPSDPRSDGDGIPDALDLIPGRDANVKVWVKIRSFDQVDWEDDWVAWSGPDTYLRSRAGLSAWGAPNDPVPDNHLSFDELRAGDHLHDEVGDNIVFSEDQGDGDNPTKEDFTEVASAFSQVWSEADYKTIADQGKIQLRWVMPLYDHDGHPNVECDDGDCEGSDDAASDLDTEAVWFDLMSIAVKGHEPALINEATEAQPNQVIIDEQTLAFGNDYTLRVRIKANVDKCSLVIGRNQVDLGSSADADHGNKYISAGVAPLNGEELSNEEENLCNID